MANFWDDAAGVLGKVAPMLATAVGGPLAGAATSAIIGALGMAPDTTQEQAAAAVVGATPDQLIQLRKADQAFAAQMKQLDIDADKLGNDDRSNARNREIQVRDWTPRALAFGLVTGFFSLLAVMMFHAAPSGSETLLNIMLGALGQSFGMMVSYYYGSSAAQVAGAPAKRPLVP